MCKHTKMKQTNFSLFCLFINLLYFSDFCFFGCCFFFHFNEEWLKCHYPLLHDFAAY